MTAVNYIKAAEIMARVEELGNPTLPVSRALVEQAKVYALMAMAPRQVVRASRELDAIRRTVAKRDKATA